MPRLRKWKNYDEFPGVTTLNSHPIPDTDTDIGDESNGEESDVVGPGDGQDASTSGDRFSDPSQRASGWWSDVAVIASMDDAKLRQTIERYRAALRTCERELQARQLASDRPRNRQKMVIVEGRTGVAKPASPRRQKTDSTSKTGRRRGRVLTAQQMLKALTMLEALAQAAPKARGQV